MSKKIDETNPYLDAKREWLERYGNYISQKRNWQIIAVLSAIISLICVIFLGYSTTQNKLIPYVIEVDKLGNTSKVGIVQNIDLKNPNVIKYSLNTFIYSWRSVWGDVEIQRKFIFDAYAYLEPNSKAFNFINEEYREKNPFKQVSNENVRVKVKSIVPQNADTWQVEWEEEVRNLKEEIISQITYRGFFQVKQIVPTSEEQILKNPLGIFIFDLNYAKIL